MELVLRIKGTIGGLKPLFMIGLVIGAILLWGSINGLSSALANPGKPRSATVSQLVDGTVTKKQYISVRGYAWYEPAYTEEEDGKTTATYFFLIDETTGHVVVVKANTKTIDDRTSQMVNLTGITASTPSELAELIEEDIPGLEEEGFETTSRLYISEGATPPALGGSLLSVIAAGILLLLCLAAFLFPNVTFAPHPLETFEIPAEGNPGVKASGKFQELKQLRPAIEVGKKTHNFTRAVANIIPLAKDKLAIYIHHIVRTYAYGVRVGKREGDWGIFLDRDNVTEIEPGKVYSLKNRWAVRFHYRGVKGKPQTLVISFDKPWGQSSFIRLLQQMGFQITEPPLR